MKKNILKAALLLFLWQQLVIQLNNSQKDAEMSDLAMA